MNSMYARSEITREIARIGPGRGPVRKDGMRQTVETRPRPASTPVSFRREENAAEAKVEKPVVTAIGLVNRRASPPGDGLLPQVHAPAAIGGVVDLVPPSVRPARAPDVGLNPSVRGMALFPDASTVQAGSASGPPPPASRYANRLPSGTKADVPMIRGDGCSGSGMRVTSQCGDRQGDDDVLIFLRALRRTGAIRPGPTPAAHSQLLESTPVARLSTFRGLPPTRGTPGRGPTHHRDREKNAISRPLGDQLGRRSLARLSFVRFTGSPPPSCATQMSLLLSELRICLRSPHRPDAGHPETRWGSPRRGETT